MHFMLVGFVFFESYLIGDNPFKFIILTQNTRVPTVPDGARGSTGRELHALSTPRSRLAQDVVPCQLAD